MEEKGAVVQGGSFNALEEFEIALAANPGGQKVCVDMEHRYVARACLDDQGP